jgi:hypothetical protein
MSVSVTTISSTLATFIGMAFGFQQVRAKAMAEEKVTKDKAAAEAAGRLISLTPWQTAAAVWYMLSLLLALAIWGWNQWHHGQCDPIIQGVGRSFLGIVGGALAVVLNVRT